LWAFTQPVPSNKENQQPQNFQHAIDMLMTDIKALALAPATFAANK
jgi:hypothetical protein